MIKIAGFQYEEPANLLLGFGVGSVRDEHFALLRPQRLGRFWRLQCLACREVAARTQRVVIGETTVEHAVALRFGHGFKLLRRNVAETYEFHRVLSLSQDSRSAA